MSVATTWGETGLRWLVWGLLAYCIGFSVWMMGCGLMAPLAASVRQFDMASLGYGWTAQTCDQIPTRSFWLVGYPMGLCARCFGLYGGFLATGLWALQKRPFYNRLWLWCLLAAGVEKVLELTGLIPSLAEGGWVGNSVRFVAGGLLGSGLLLIFRLIFIKLLRITHL